MLAYGGAAFYALLFACNYSSLNLFKEHSNSYDCRCTSTYTYAQHFLHTCRSTYASMCRWRYGLSIAAHNTCLALWALCDHSHLQASASVHMYAYAFTRMSSFIKFNPHLQHHTQAHTLAINSLDKYTFVLVCICVCMFMAVIQMQPHK